MKKMDKMSLGNRLRIYYESRGDDYLIRRIPVIMRLDGNAFHTLTKKCAKPFDEVLQNTMEFTAINLCNRVQGFKCAYIQSDEISVLLTDFDTIRTGAWFDYNKSHVESISAGIASAYFSIKWTGWSEVGIFDCRARNYPKEEVCNYFIHRQQDWIRNSINMYARTMYSHNQLHCKNQSQRHEMLHEKGLNWAKLSDKWKNGTFIFKHGSSFCTSYNTIFKNERDIVDRYMRFNE